MAKKSNDIYRVALLKNKKFHKIFKEYKLLTYALKEFNKNYQETNVFFKKNYEVNKYFFREHDIELVILKKTPNDVIQKQFVDSNGVLVTQTIKGGWDIIKSQPIIKEETFHVYGLNKRLPFFELIKQVFLTRTNEMYEITVVLNKIVLHSKKDIEVILCKNTVDAYRLYNLIHEKFNHQDIDNFAFSGISNKDERKMLYDRIQAHTGLVRKELFRTKTRS